MGTVNPTARGLSGPSISAAAAPVKSILKPVSSLGKRTAEDASLSDNNEPPSSPSKRRKVLFDEIRNVTYEVSAGTTDNIKVEVRLALQDHLRGDDGPYDSIKALFARDASRTVSSSDIQDGYLTETQDLKAHLIGLMSCITILKDKNCNGLVRAILKSSWLGREEDYVKVYTHFLAALASAQGSYLMPILNTLVEKFQDHHVSSWTLPYSPEIDRDSMRDRLHSTLQYILRTIPAATTVLEGVLSHKFPFPDESRRTHMAYIHNLIRVKDYIPSMEDEILDLILSRVVKIDAQMQVDLEDVDDEIAADAIAALKEEQSQQQLEWEDGERGESDDESVHSDDEAYDPVVARVKTLKESVEKMDAILDTLFEYYNPYFANPGSDTAFDAFTIILREFDQIVLPTYKSRHTQFLVFHFAQLHERLSDAFCGQLIATAFQGNTPNVLRQAAAAYLASFVARGAHVPRTLVRQIFQLLLHHLEQYRRKYEPTCRGPDLKRFHPYYSLVQATLYIFCFRWQDLIVSAPEFVDPEDPASYIGQDLEWMGTIKKDLSKQLFGKLNPLKVCAPVIVDEFAKLAVSLKFIYVSALVETNKRIRLTQYLSSTYATGGALRDSGTEAQAESFHQLDPYFPFDPYQLPVSKRWLEGDYVLWKSMPGLNDDSEDESDYGGEDVEEDAEVDEATATDDDDGDY